MSKLTEIKIGLEEAEDVIDSGFFTETEKELLKDTRYLISLLEEKDKALAFYADENSYFRAPRHQLTYIELDNGKKARKALNTSSNNEGETI